MPETAKSQTSWRLDRVDARNVASWGADAPAPRSGSAAGSLVSNSAAPGGTSTERRFLPGWNQALRNWLRTRFERSGGGDAGFEEIVHRFVATALQADD